jgi:hypothetical protein
MKQTKATDLSIAVRDDTTMENGYIKIEHLAYIIAETVLEVLDEKKENMKKQ